MNSASYTIEAEEGPWVSAKTFPDGNTGHRPPIKGGYFPVPPVDGQSDIRAEMLSIMDDMGLKVEKHHHEVAPRQAELGTEFDTLVKTADGMQIYKYVVHNVANQYGKTATFMPKPIKGDNGSGMHTHQSIWKGERPLFAGNVYADLSETALYLHRRHHQARQGDQRLHQPDDQQLQAAHPGVRGAGAAGLFGAQPLGLVPHPDRLQPQGEARRGAFPRPGLQPLSRLCRDADGRARRHPEQDPSRRPDGQEPLRPAAGGAEGRPDRLRLAARGARRARGRPRLPPQGRRVHRDQIESYIELKWEEVYAFEHTPHPIEFMMYYSV